MPKISVIWKTLTITKSPYKVLLMKLDKSRKRLTFRSGLTCNLTWPQFRVFRDAYPLLLKYSVTQMDDDLFKVKDDKKSDVVCTSHLLPVILDLMGDFVINQVKEDTFCATNGKFTVVGSSGMLICIQELKTGEYESDCQDKVVLDVGGFEGESAAYFWSKKAKKIIIYEPVAAHIEWIKKNISLNSINAEIHEAGIGDKKGTKIIYYTETDPGFGFHSSGTKSMEINIRNVSEVIMESGANLAKFDCEGAEESLVKVPDEILRQIEYYIIEVHSLKIRDDVLAKFQEAGFTLEKETPKRSDFSVLAFRRQELLKRSFNAQKNRF